MNQGKIRRRKEKPRRVARRALVSKGRAKYVWKIRRLLARVPWLGMEREQSDYVAWWSLVIGIRKLGRNKVEGTVATQLIDKLTSCRGHSSSDPASERVDPGLGERRRGHW